MMRTTEVYVPNMNINTPMTMIRPSLKKTDKGTRPSPSEVRVRIWMKIGKITASAVQLMEPTREMKLSSWGILTAKRPEWNKNRNHWFVNTPGAWFSKDPVNCRARYLPGPWSFFATVSKRVLVWRCTYEKCVSPQCTSRDCGER